MEQNILEHKYLAYIGLVDRVGRGIGLDKSFEELDMSDIEKADYMYCRDIESGEGVYIFHDDIKQTIETYNNKLLRKLKGSYSVGEFERLCEKLDEAKANNFTEEETLDLLWSTSHKFDDKDLARTLRKSRR